MISYFADDQLDFIIAWHALVQNSSKGVTAILIHSGRNFGV